MIIQKQLTVNSVNGVKKDFISESGIEAYIDDNPSILKLDDSDAIFSDSKVINNQVVFKRAGKRRVGGRIDLLGSYGDDYTAIIEIKKGKITKGNLGQITTYINDIDKIENNQQKVDSNFVINPKKLVAVLVGTDVDLSFAHSVTEGKKISSSIKNKKYKIPIAVIVVRRFEGKDYNIYVITDTYFKKPNSKDYTLYKIKGYNKPFNKSRLVNEIVKIYVSQNQNLTSSGLKEVFEDDLQGSFGVFTDLSTANQKNTPIKRYYTGEGEIIDLKDCTIATSNQWGVGNIKKFKDKANELLGEGTITEYKEET